MLQIKFVDGTAIIVSQIKIKGSTIQYYTKDTGRVEMVEAVQVKSIEIGSIKFKR